MLYDDNVRKLLPASNEQQSNNKGPTDTVLVQHCLKQN